MVRCQLTGREQQRRFELGGVSANAINVSTSMMYYICIEVLRVV